MSLAGSRFTSAAGFTLLEFLVVLAILSLVLAIVPANLIRGTGAQALKADARQLAGILHYARTWAISRNGRITVAIDPQTKQISVDGRALGTLSDTTEVAIRSGPEGPRMTVEFLPDGSSSGGNVLLSYQLLRYRLSVNWLTGAVATYQE